MAGLNGKQKKAFRAVLPVMLGIPDEEAPLVDQAVKRLDQYLDALPRAAAGDGVRTLLTAVYVYSWFRFVQEVDDLDRAEVETLCKELIDCEGTALDTIADFIGDFFGDQAPTVRDMAKSLREMCALAFYTNPKTSKLVGWTPPWANQDIVDQVGGIPVPPADIDVTAIRQKHAEMPSGPWFANDGRKKVAVIGSGAGGAVAAAALAAHYDVAVFEAGPGFRPSEYPWDYMAGMALMLEDGLLTLNKNLDIHIFRGRLVGGSTVLTSGMTIETPDSKIEEWRAHGFEPDSMRAALRSVEERLRIREIHTDLVSDPGELWGAAGADLPGIIMSRPKANVATHPGQSAGLDIPDTKGDRCFGCNLCNLGCHWGHHLAMDITYLLDAKARGAKVHPNTAIKHLTAEVDPRTRKVQVNGLVLYRDPHGTPIAVDYVVLAAGAIGSPALLLRSIDRQPAFRRTRSAQRLMVGDKLGFNYGTTVVARFPEGKVQRPMDRGIIINYVGAKEGDHDFVLENAGVPPGLLASVVPGYGADHRAWIRSYPRLGMAVNTIGSPQRGRVGKKQEVSYTVTDGEMDTIRRTLAIIVQMYLKSGAELVGLAGVRATDDRKSLFDQTWAERSEAEILARIVEAVPSAEHLMLSSAHPQGGLRMSADPEQGVVGPDFRVHDTLNLFVADASVFPSTIVVNPQWTVNAVGQLAGDALHRYVAQVSAGGGS